MIRQFLVCFFCFFSAWPVVAEEAGASSGLPLPRFASLRTNETNMRVGPGMRYPIEWILKSEDLPVEIIAEYDVWRRVRDWDMTEGWVHQSALSGRRTLIVTGENKQTLRKSDEEASPAVALLDPWAIGRILACTETWCKVRFDSVEGYLPKSAFWGVYPNETWR